jgi:hypothetical protein
MGARVAQAVRTASPNTTARGGARPPFGARRVSGPAVARAALAIPAGSVAAPAPARRPVVLPKPPKPGNVGHRVGLWVRGLPDHSWLDRLVRGRAWIVVLGIALIGIVAMQVSELKLNAGMGRAMTHEETLRQENAALLTRVSALSSNYRVQEYAVNHGFVFPDPGQVRFLPVDPRLDAKLAAHRMTAPSAEARIIAGQAARPKPAIAAAASSGQ